MTFYVGCNETARQCDVLLHDLCELRTATLLTYTAIPQLVNPLKGRGNYIATSNNMKFVHWPLIGGLLLTFGTAMRGLGGAPARPGPSSLYEM